METFKNKPLLILKQHNVLSTETKSFPIRVCPVANRNHPTSHFIKGRGHQTDYCGLATWCEKLTHWKRPWCWERLKVGEGDDRGWDGWMASLTRWTWVWVNSGSWWWTGRPGMLQSMGLQRVGHNWATELNWLWFLSVCIQGTLKSLFQLHSSKPLILWMSGFFAVHLSHLYMQFHSVAQSYLALCDPMDRSMPGFPVHHQLPDLTQTHVHRVRDAIEPSHPLSSPSPTFNLSQHQGFFQWVSSLH